MAQVRKEEVQTRLYRAAKAEFLAKGFAGASLRSIASCGKISLANIYSYAKDKDDLFRGVLANVVGNFEALTHYFKNYHHEMNDFDSLEVEEARMEAAVAYIEKNRIELHLLLNLSAGSSLATFPEKIIEGYSGNCVRFLKHLKKQNQNLAFKEPSETFFKNVARFALRATGEMVKEKTSKKEMEKLAR